MIAKPILRFARKRLGLKNLVDYVESRQTLLGLTNLNISTVLDIGANKGRRARNYRRLFPDAKIYCIEPIPRLCQQLERWGNKQGGKVQVLNLALSSSASTSSFYIDRLSDIWSSLQVASPEDTDRYEKITVEVDTLDHLAERIDLSKDVLIKIDTEGLDLEVIRGGEKTLQQSAALIVESTFYPTHYGDDSPIFEEILAALGEQGYVYRGNIRCGWLNGTCFCADSLFVRREAASRLLAA